MNKKPTHKLYKYRDCVGKHRWRIEAVNGEIIADSGQGVQRPGQRDTTIQNMVNAFCNGTVQVITVKKGYK